MPVSLDRLVRDFAAGLSAADAKRPVFVSRTGRQYQPGLGPHGEDRAVALVLAEMRTAHPETYERCGHSLPYPGSRQKCDLWFGEPLEWAVEVRWPGSLGTTASLTIRR